MKILQISECFPTSYKPQTCEFILRHAEALSELCNVKFVVPLRMIPPREALKGGTTGLLNWYKSAKQTKGFSEGNLEVCFVNYISLPRPAFESVDSALVNAFFSKRISAEVDAYNPDVIVCHWLRPWAGVAVSIAKSLEIPVVIDHHEDLPTLKNLFPGKYKRFLKPLQEADAVVVHSQRNKQELTRELNLKCDVRVVYLGQDLGVTSRVNSVSGGKLKLVTVSHLYEPRKNIDVLIRALAIVCEEQDAELTIAGDGPLKDRLMNIAAQTGVQDRVTFAGVCSQDEVRKLLDESDIFILPSFPEAFGIAITEALARGVPAVTCKGSGGGEELRALGYDAPMAEPESAEDLARCILEIAGDRDLATSLSAKGTVIVKQHFTWQKNAEDTLSVLTEVLNNSKQKINVRN